ncbi:MAG: AI-2E family transporter [Acidobacteriota bacterium]
MDSRQVARLVALLTLLVISLYLCWQMLQPFANVLLWALVLATVFSPVHRRIEARLRKPSLSAAVSTLLVVVTILAPVTFLTLAVIGELRDVALSAHDWQIPTLDTQSPLFGPIVRWVGQYVDLPQVSSPEFIRDQLQAWSGVLAAGTLGFVGGFLAAAVQTLLVVFTLYYLFRDGAAINESFYDILPLERAQVHDIVTRTREVIAGSVYGVVLISAVQGALGCFIFWALGLPSPLLWGVVMFALSMIPMAGAFLVWAPTALYLAVSGAYSSALILTVWGLQVFGVVGVILGPVVVAIALAVLEMVRELNRPTAETMGERTITERQDDVRQVS